MRESRIQEVGVEGVPSHQFERDRIKLEYSTASTDQSGLIAVRILLMGVILMK